MNILEEWIAAVCAELGIAVPIDRDLVLDMTREVAHGVARPAAPLTAYLVGLAAGNAADPPAATVAAVGQVVSLAQRWPTEQ
ncbi:MAG: DUF6457 domain-containing protein [Actinomycetota bacterium]|nr:DUF6457 domain-containing protein [Actinomycetota bacterium]